MACKFSVLIVEDEPLIAEDIAGYLDEYGFYVTGIASDANAALHFFKNNSIDAVLLDINLGDGIDGIDLAEIIRNKYKVPFIFLTSHSDKGTLERAKKTIPAGYLHKPFDGGSLMTSLEIAISNHLANNHTLSKEQSLKALNENLPVHLSQREFDLLQLVQTGKTNKEIAECLFISVNTVKTHLKHLFEKLDVSNRTQALFKIKQFLEG